MTQKIIKQDVMNSLKNNLSESNIQDLLQELNNKSLIDFETQILKKGYMW